MTYMFNVVSKCCLKIGRQRRVNTVRLLGRYDVTRENYGASRGAYITCNVFRNCRITAVQFNNNSRLFVQARHYIVHSVNLGNYVA